MPLTVALEAGGTDKDRSLIKYVQMSIFQNPPCSTPERGSSMSVDKHR